jgi:hypothetical protein
VTDGSFPANESIPLYSSSPSLQQARAASPRRREPADEAAQAEQAEPRLTVAGSEPVPLDPSLTRQAQG